MNTLVTASSLLHQTRRTYFTLMTNFFRSLLLTLAIAMGMSLSADGQVIGIDLLDEDREVEVPFELEQGFIIVKVWLNGIIPLRMIFDTGAENTILFDKEIAQILGIEFERKIPIMGSDLDSVLIANIARNVSTNMEGCQAVTRDIIVLDDNNLLIEEKLGTQINGIVGGSYFANLVVNINYRKRKITFTHPAEFNGPPKYYQSYPIDVISGKPYLSGDVGISSNKLSKLNLLLDTGAALPFLIHTNTDTSLALPERVMVGSVGFGLSGAIFGFRGKCKRLELGEIYFNEIVTSFQDLNFEEGTIPTNIIRNGIIGNSLLSRFSVIINYTTSTLHLKPYRKKYNKDFSFDKSGITLFAVGPDLNQYYVVAVIDGSPASEAGVMPGDLIIKMGRKKAKKLSLNRITDKLSRKEGKSIKLTVLRENEEIKIAFKLKEWFNDVPSAKG